MLVVFLCSCDAMRDKQKFNSYQRKYQLKRYHRRRKEAIAFLGDKCSKCGSIQNLELDHIDRKLKSFSIAKIWSYTEERFWSEIKKCQVLCQKCHSDKTILERGFKIAKGNHGTVSSYRYCRCTLCRAASTQANREYRRRKKLACVTQ